MNLLAWGYPVIPSGSGDSGKAPYIPWQKYQESEYPLPDDLLEWEEQYHPSLWGVVTGKTPGIVIVDVDRPDFKIIFDKEGLQPHIQTPRGGYHYWFRHPNKFVKTCAGILPSIDIRGDGGFVNVIGKRSDGEYKVLIPPTPESIYSWDKLPSIIKEAIDKPIGKPHPQSSTISMGQRNARLASIAGSLHRQGISGQALIDALKVVNDSQCEEPLPDNEVENIAKSINKKPEDGINNSGLNKPSYYLTSGSGSDTNHYETITETITGSVIEEWVKQTTGWCTTDELDKELSIKSQEEKNLRRVTLHRLREKGTVEQHPKDNKRFRHVKTEVRLIDFKRAGGRAPLEVYYPLRIEDLYHTRPGNIIVVAGAPDSGKTAFLLNVVRMNMDSLPIFYQSSEMGEDELANRLEKFDNIDLQDWNFTVEERSSNFADGIRPDCVNIIDYMEFSNGDYFLIADYLKQIHDKLGGGIAIVALQKNRGAEIGVGGNRGLEKPRLYITLDSGKATIQKCKNWANPYENPNGLILNYKLVAGCKFVVTTDWFKPTFP